MDYPDYSYPLHIVPGLALDLLFGRRRSFRRDGLACVSRLKPTLQVVGEEYIPCTGPCLVTFNHYYRHGFNAWWMALGIASVVPVEMHWIMTNELTFPGKWYASLGMTGSRWLLKRLAKVYGFTTMPPMPPRPEDVEARAASVRRALSYVKENPDTVLGLAPEGGDNALTGTLAWPASGVGRFLLLLAKAGLRFLPVGTYEEDGIFYLNFGVAYQLGLPHELPSGERDRQVAKIVMEHIAVLLPPRLRGAFLT